MSLFWGTVHYEYRMMMRRWGVWLAFALAAGVVLAIVLSARGQAFSAFNESVWQSVGLLSIDLNRFLAVVAGIALADRLARDTSLGVDELLRSTPLSRGRYVFSKYLGALLGVLTPAFACVLAVTVTLVAFGVRVEAIGAETLAFLVVSVPTYAFVGAFALACTSVLPVRVYQILFTGYWFWGNYLSPRLLPTVSETILNASGKYAAFAFFGAAGPGSGSTLEAVANLAVLASCAAAALIALTGYLKWQDRRA